MEAEIKDGDFPMGEKYPHNHIMLGGDSSNPSWKEYLEGFKEEFRSYIIAIKEVLEKEGKIGATGGSFCNFHYFEFDDEHKTKVGFSWRAFGDLMQAIVDKREGYMAYYM